MSLVTAVVAGVAAAAPLLAASAAWVSTRQELPADNWGLRPLTGAKAAWLTELVGRARPVLEAADMPVSVAIGQAAIETGWGRHGLTNPWGLRGAGDVGSNLMSTTEVFDPAKGPVTLKNQKFARFSSVEAAAQGYASFLHGKSYRPGLDWRQNDSGAWLLYLWGMGYATATHYAVAVLGTSRKAAVTLGDPSLAIKWTERHSELARDLSTYKAGAQRRARTRLFLNV